MVWKELRTSSLATHHKKAADDFYQKYKKSLKALPDLLGASLKTYDGKIIKLANVVTKGKPLFLDFWATWCAPCIAALPALKITEKDHPNIRFITLSIDENEAVWHKFVKEKNLNPKNSFLLVAPKENLLIDTYSITDVPRYILFNSKGVCLSSNFYGPDYEGFDHELNRVFQ